MQYEGYIPRGLCQCGCGQRTSIARQTRPEYGMVKGEPLRFMQGHNRRKLGPQYVVRENGCWEWQHGRTSEGYGALDGRGAHCVFWERENGPLPQGVHVHHKCENPPCVNPAHLEPKVALAHATDHGRARSPLTAADVRMIRSIPWTRSSAQQLAERFGMNPNAIRNVRRGDTWKDL